MIPKHSKTFNDDDELIKPLVDVEDGIPTPKKTASKAKVTRRGMSGCCKCLVITLALLVAMSFIASIVAYHCLSDAVKHLTVKTPHEKLPVVEMTDEELRAVQKRVELFVDEVLAGHRKEPLTVTQDEINGAIGHSDYLRGNMFYTIKDGAMEEQVSLPMYMLPGGKGRSFVAHDYLHIMPDQTLEIKMETAATHHDWFDGPLLFAQLHYMVNEKTNLWELYLKKGSFFGQEAPKDFIDQSKNLLEDFLEDEDHEDIRKVVEHIKEVRIEKGQIVVVPRTE